MMWESPNTVLWESPNTVQNDVGVPQHDVGQHCVVGVPQQLPTMRHLILADGRELFLGDCANSIRRVSFAEYDGDL